MDYEEIQEILTKDPGNAVFIQHAESLRQEGKYDLAITICLKGLSANPNAHRGRLVLAHALYQMNCLPFAISQLQLLAEALPEDKVIRRLLEKLSHGTIVSGEGNAASSETRAEAEFDFEEIDLLEE